MPQPYLGFQKHLDCGSAIRPTEGVEARLPSGAESVPPLPGDFPPVNLATSRLGRSWEGTSKGQGKAW